MERSEVKTTLFVIGPSPYKGTIFLPQREARITIKRVTEAIAQQKVKSLPPLPQGHFLVLNYVDDGQVAMFYHHKVVGCRETNSEAHGQLPLPSFRLRELTTFTQEPNLRVGFEYIYGYCHQYSIADGKVQLGNSLPPLSPMNKQLTEHARTSNMVQKLREHFKSYKIVPFGRNSSHLCPFSGGGDIEVYSTSTSSLSAAVVTGATEDEDDSGSPDTHQCSESPTMPPKLGEERFGSLELKVSGQQKEKEVEMQLQANMIVTCATLLESKILAGDDVLSAERLIYYGLMMGPTCSLKLLKLTLDFENEQTLYETLFHLPPCSFYPVYVDIAIDHIFKNVK